MRPAVPQGRRIIPHVILSNAKDPPIELARKRNKPSFRPSSRHMTTLRAARPPSLDALYGAVYGVREATQAGQTAPNPLARGAMR